MGGRSKTIKNANDKRVTTNDQIFWSAIIDLAGAHKDEFPFTAQDVVRLAMGYNFGSAITRQRGGLKKFHLDYRAAFVKELRKLVKGEEKHSGPIESKFCRNLSFLIADYYELFAIDIVSDSHRNTKVMLDEIRILIEEGRLPFFALELYLLLKDWHKDGFSRDLIFSRYAKRMEELFLKYQIRRPDMGITTSDGRSKGEEGQ